MGKGWVVIILFLLCRLDAAALPSKEVQINVAITKLNNLIYQYNSINTFDKKLYAKRLQILKKISKKAKSLYEVTGDIKFAKTHETYFNEAQELINFLNNQKNNTNTEAKFSGRSKKNLKPWKTSLQGAKIAPLTNYGYNLSMTQRNLNEFSDLTNKMNPASLLADNKAMTNLHRMAPSDQNFQEFSGGRSLSFAPSTRDMDASSYAPQAPRRLAQERRQAEVD
jgi:hypothetical protein